MKVYGKCKNCKNEIDYSISRSTRVEFAMKDGENITLNCKNCGTANEFYVDELYAKESKITQIVAGLIFLIGTPLSFLFIGLIYSLIPVIIFGIMLKKDRMRVNYFNRLNLKGRIHNIGKKMFHKNNYK